jgi:hypothetical protein
MKKILLFAAIFLSFPAWSVDGASLELGHGERDLNILRGGLQWNWNRKWLAAGGWHLDGYWDLAAGIWWNARKDIYDFSLTPTFRYQRAAGGSPYVEAAIGFHLISTIHVADNRDFSSRFQFGDHLGAGFRFGERNRWDLGVRLQHLSNAGIRNPNPGINFLQLRLQRHFD